MKVIILCCALMLFSFHYDAMAAECAAKEGWPFTLTESDLDLLTSIANAKDSAAAEQMSRQGRLFYFKKGVRVQHESGFTVSKFRVPGTTVYGYTYREALDCN